MKAERRKKIEDLCYAALEQEESKRKAFLEEACGGDDALRREVESLLAQEEKVEDFLEAPALEVAAKAMVQDQVPSMVGREMGSYKVLSLLGTGGMGEVYLAEDTKLDRRVALKFLPREMQQDETARKRFLREAKSAAALDHAYVCHIHEVGEEEGKSFISMEYVQGETLKDQLKKGPLPLQDALAKATEIAEALEAAHRQNIIHRDLKPSNIMITPDGHVKVLDFGLAKRLTPAEGGDSQEKTLTASLTRTGDTLGTVPYMSPEQLRGEAVDTRSDIFSFGVTLYEMLTGMEPFKQAQPADTASSILTKDPPPLSRYMNEVSPVLQHTVRKMLAKDPDRRYQLIHEVGTDLGEILHGGEDSFEIAPAAEGSWKRWIPWSIAALAVLTAATLAIWNHLPDTISQTPPGIKRTTIDLPTPYMVGPPVAWRIALSPDGRHLVYVGERAQGHAIYHRAMDQTEALPLPGTEGASRLFFSPDGEWVGFYASGAMKKVSLKGGQPLIISELDPYFGASWGKDGNIVFGGVSSGLSRVSATGGIPQKVTTPDKKRGEIAHAWPKILPGGHAIVFDIRLPGTVGTGDKKSPLGVLSLETGEWKTIAEDGHYGHYLHSGHLTYLHSELGHMVVAFDLSRLEVIGDPVASPTLEAVDYAVSNDGTLVYRSPHGDWGELVLVDHRGGTQAGGKVAHRFAQPRFSPNGEYVALTVKKDETRKKATFSGTSDIWVYEIARGILTPVTFTDTSSESVWTPDGKRITFRRFLPEARGIRSSIYWKAADGSGIAEELTSAPGLFPTPHSWSPDGKVLTFTTLQQQTSSDIWVFSLEGERKPQLFQGTRFREWHPMFSPDGRWIAFTSNRSGRDEVYVKAYPAGSGLTRISTEGGSQPLWGVDGKELFYRNGRKMMVVAVGTAAPFTASPSRFLFEGPYLGGINSALARNYDISPDGRRFAMIKGAATSLRQLNVVQNWFEEIKRLVPTGK